MKVTRIIATSTALAVGISVLTVPAQAAETQASTSPKAITVTLEQSNKVKTCHFVPNPKVDDDDSSMLTVNDRYFALLESIKRGIRAGLPVDASLFAQADAITGTGPIAKPGSLDDPELARIVAKVGKDMTTQGFAPSEIHFAFYHSRQGAEFADSIGAQNLNILAPMTLMTARDMLARKNSSEQSIASMSDRYYHAVAKVRIFLTQLPNSSIALLNRIDDAKVTSLKQAVRTVTQQFPSVIEGELRSAIRTCVSKQRLSDFYDMSASSRFTQDGSTGSSNDDSRPSRGNFWSASSELAQGHGLSSVDEIKTAVTAGSSKNTDDNGEGWKKKASTILFIAGGIITIATALMRFSKLFTALANVAAGKIKLTDTAANK